MVSIVFTSSKANLDTLILSQKIEIIVDFEAHDAYFSHFFVEDENL